jgi:hypothetical protein
MRCPTCGNINLEPAGACQVCGAALTATDPHPLSPEPGADPAAAQLPLTTSLYQALLGPVHADYYLSRFARFDAAGRTAVSWHWPAFFATFAWLVFRRMWAHALAFFGFSVAAALALFGVLPLVTTVSQEWQWSLTALFLAVECVLPALWANAVYYRHCNRLLTQTLQSAPDIRETAERLAALSSSRRRAIVVGALNAMVWLAVCALGAWLALAAPVGPVRSAAAPARAASAATAVASAAGAANAALPLPPAAAASQAAAAASAPIPQVAASAVATVASAPLPLAAASAATPVASAPASVASAVALAAPASAPVKAKPLKTPRPDATTPARAKVEKPPAKPKEAASAAKASASRGRFVVAVGQFALEQNADRAYAKLEAAGLPVHSNTTQSETGPLLLIRVGPFRTLVEARQAAQQVRKLGLPAVVMRR